MNNDLPEVCNACNFTVQEDGEESQRTGWTCSHPQGNGVVPNMVSGGLPPDCPLLKEQSK